ncbi:MAG: hypothetical protein EOO75_18105 [Myxococcales bacterium]|nr:MAG: hypothetical protein EOO75_18105 [Myxococcales bacterium]
MRFHSGLRHVCAAAGLLSVSLGAAEAGADPSSLPPEMGWNYGEQETPRTAAMGGASRALGADINGLFTNPANLAASRVYHLAALGQIWPEANRQSYGAAAIDSATSRLAAGVGGFYTLQDSEGLKRKGIDARLGLAFPLGDRIFVGATGKLLRLEQNGLGPLGSSLASGGLKNTSIVNGMTFDAGLTVRPISLLSLAIVGTNLTNPGDGYRPLGLGGGIAIGQRQFAIEADMTANFTTYDKTKFRYMVGGELLIADTYPLRAGYRFDQGLQSHLVTGGAGYLDRQFGVELSVQRGVSGPSSTAIILGLQLFLEGIGLARGAEDIDIPGG